jgi:hypothetical protein
MSPPGTFSIKSALAATLKILHQGRQIDPIVDGTARLGERAAEAQRFREIEEVVVIVVMIPRVLPVIDAEIVLARDRHVMMRDGVEQPHAPILFRCAIGDEGGVHAMLLQVKSEMQTGDPGADDSNVTCHVSLPWSPLKPFD